MNPALPWPGAAQESSRNCLRRLLSLNPRRSDLTKPSQSKLFTSVLTVWTPQRRKNLWYCSLVWSSHGFFSLYLSIVSLLQTAKEMIRITHDLSTCHQSITGRKATTFTLTLTYSIRLIIFSNHLKDVFGGNQSIRRWTCKLYSERSSVWLEIKPGTCCEATAPIHCLATKSFSHIEKTAWNKKKAAYTCWSQR